MNFLENLIVPKLKIGQRYNVNLSRDLISADSLFLANFINKNKKLNVIITASSEDSHRILNEIKFFSPNLKSAILPDWETLPYDNISPHQDLISQRLSTLWQVYNNNLDILLISATTALYKLSPPSFLASFTFNFKQGQKLNEAQLKSQLSLAGYLNVNQVLSHGEYSIRGGIIDLFPMGSNLPYRLDLFDDEIETIKSFDPDSQRSLFKVNKLQLLPGREFSLDKESKKVFKENWQILFEDNSEKSQLFKDINNNILIAGIEYYLSLFFKETATIFNYLPKDSNLIFQGNLENVFQNFWRDTNDRFKILKGDFNRPILEPKHLFLNINDFFIQAKNYYQLAIKINKEKENLANHEIFKDFQVINNDLKGLKNIQEYILNNNLQNNKKILFLAESLGRRENLFEVLNNHKINPKIIENNENLNEFIENKNNKENKNLGLIIGNLNQGFSYKNIYFITENELFNNSTIKQKNKRNFKEQKPNNLENLIKDLSEINIGDLVVHSQHGIGRYLGLKVMALNENEQEFLHLEYADNSTLYVPINQLFCINRYSGINPENTQLNKLGSDKWNKEKQKATKQILDIAAELLNIYSKRATKKGFSFKTDFAEYQEFCEDFLFEETIDQKNAIATVLADMNQTKPMDRLICGDVGFGKTEIALRAAFISAMNGKQVAFLVPTTLLAEQHFQTLKDRFSKWAINVAEISRFKSKKETEITLKGLKNGSIDIVVGTHKLLSERKDKNLFKNLGLLIIDEEHRFGVRQKELMKNLKSEIDILTLTATPIPRTMGMALEGLRDLSIISTAPQKRLKIKTFVRDEDNSIIREAIQRELNRGGQIYFLHNDVATIKNRFESLQKILPESRIAIAHGQMPERELEKVMRDFIAQRFNILLCSTIIETGIDVANANTIIISRADKFGLSQLHQLRGRVGRSHHQAYAYLLVLDKENLTKQANQRLEAICELEELGSGFYLSMHDLEIRGAGEILGSNQSGNITEIGFQLYNEMLNKAVKSLKEGKEPDLMTTFSNEAEINFHAPTLLPKNYCEDIHLRLSFYKQLSYFQTEEEINNLMEEIIDRFGKLPEEARNLFNSHKLRVLANSYKISKIDLNDKIISINFDNQPNIDTIKLIKLIQNKEKNKFVKLAGNDKLKINHNLINIPEKIQLIKNILNEIS